MTGPARSTDGYAAEAATLAVRYESIRFEDVHADILHLVPAAPRRVIDIGAGTGRDAAALAARGHRVLAVEPTVELRAAGERLHPEAGIIWLDDGLPDLARVRAASDRFDLAFLTAVWMHLDSAERQAAMRALDDLVVAGGRVFMTLRHGPVPPGRRMFEVTAEETVALAAATGFAPVHESRRGDMLERDAVTWTMLVLEKGRPA